MTYAPPAAPPIRLRELPADEHPRQRLNHAGAPALSDTELLALIIGSDTLDLPRHILQEFGGWLGLQRAGLTDLQAAYGIGPARAAQLKAVYEVHRRLLLADQGARFQIKSPADVARLMQAEMGMLEQEHLRVICVDTKNRIQHIHTVYIGSLNASMVRVGEVFREAVRRNSAAIVVVHNHPSGDPTPSPEDVLVTREIVQAGKILDIDTLDHLVIGTGRYISMREHGLGFS
jgi:DNA repair protein RadC